MVRVPTNFDSSPASGEADCHSDTLASVTEKVPSERKDGKVPVFQPRPREYNITRLA